MVRVGWWVNFLLGIVDMTIRCGYIGKSELPARACFDGVQVGIARLPLLNRFRSYPYDTL